MHNDIIGRLCGGECGGGGGGAGLAALVEYAWAWYLRHVWGWAYSAFGDSDLAPLALHASCARETGCLLLLHLRALGRVRFDVNAIASSGRTAAQCTRSEARWRGRGVARGRGRGSWLHT